MRRRSGRPAGDRAFRGDIIWLHQLELWDQPLCLPRLARVQCRCAVARDAAGERRDKACTSVRDPDPVAALGQRHRRLATGMEVKIGAPDGRRNPKQALDNWAARRSSSRNVHAERRRIRAA